MSADRQGARRVLVVCLGNHCRSPLGAAALARHSPPGMEVRSAGLVGKHQGRPAHPAMIQAAAALGYDLAGHIGAQVTVQMLDWADLVLAMDRAVLAELRAFAGDRARPELRLYAEGRHLPVPEQGRWLASVVTGHQRYYAVPGNHDAANAFRSQAIRLWRFALSRRSQKGYVTWDRMSRLASRYIPDTRIMHPWPNVRFAARYP